MADKRDMQIAVSSSDKVLIEVNRHELALLDYALSYLQTHQHVASDLEIANQMEQALFATYCNLPDEAR